MTYQVNLPVTDFPMRGNLPKKEPEWLEFWKKIDLYNKIIAENRDKSFIIHDGPPYANGNIHLGHAFDKILKDVINKSKLLEGYKINFIPGWDCHGLPIELNVEKKKGKPKQDHIEDFITACREYALEQVALQKESFERLGVLADWKYPYRTLDFAYEARIVEALGEILNAGYLVPGFKPVHWCADCGSALAEAEVEYREKESPAIDVKFTLIDSPFHTIYPVILPIWTTTPWTLLANEAVCVHAELNYVLVEVKEKQVVYILNEELAKEALERYEVVNYSIVGNVLGKQLENLYVQHPFLDKKVPVILGSHVTNTAGTGIVHTAPAHGLDDYKVGLIYHLPVNILLDDRSHFLEEIDIVGGLSVFEANKVIIDLLYEKGALLSSRVLSHSYPHCWRHKKPLIFRATKQWFISIDLPGKDGESLKDKAAKILPEIEWYPASGENSLSSMIEKRYDWCISRQRYYGVPLTLFIHRSSGNIHPEMVNLIRTVIVPAIKNEGVVYWHQLDVQDFLSKYSPEDKENYVKVSDTLDVWFDSGVSHFAVLKERGLDYPADLYTEGVDQYRGWFQSSLLTALAIDGKAPYRQILTHGFTVDEHGRKMSKSLGNVVVPGDIINKYGADILRFWVASSFLHDDIRLSNKGLDRLSDSYRLVRNTIRFLLGNLYQFRIENKVILDELLPLDRYLVEILLDLINTVRSNYSKYCFYQAMSVIQRVLTNELSSFYFSVIKDRLYTLPVDHLARRSAQTVLWYWLEGLVRIIAPVLSFTAEETWQTMGSFKQLDYPSVFLATWGFFDNLNFKTKAKFNKEDWDRFLELRELINRLVENLRIQGKVGSSLAVEVILYAEEREIAFWKRFGSELRFLLIVSDVKIFSLAERTEKAVKCNDQLFVDVDLSLAKKCTRCWHWHSSVGECDEHEDLCERCIENLFGAGEKRLIG